MQRRRIYYFICLSTLIASIIAILLKSEEKMEVVYSKLSDKVFVFHYPSFRFLDLLRIGTRMSVIALKDGGTLIYSPIPISESVLTQVEHLGPPRYIVCPNQFHHLFVEEWVARYPQAKLIGPKELSKKAKGSEFQLFF